MGSDSAGGGDTTSSGCRKVVLFLTDGECTTQSCSGKDPNDIMANIGSDVTVFTYTMAGESNVNRPKIPRKMACMRNGVYTNIPAGADPALYMTKYYQYLAAGTNGSSQIRWSTPYIDGGGLGKMVSVARPVYTTVAIANRATHKQLAAVVGTDVLMEELETHLGYEQVVSRLIAKSKNCPAIGTRYAVLGASTSAQSWAVL